MVKIYASSDHAGTDLRVALVRLLKEKGVAVDDRGPPVGGGSIDYPDEGARVARLVRDNPDSRGLLVCGSGIGVCMAANKIAGIRAANPWNHESARLSRAHNDANVLCLGGRMLTEREAADILFTWLETPFEGGRHATRVAKLAALDDPNR